MEAPDEEQRTMPPPVGAGASPRSRLPFPWPYSRSLRARLYLAFSILLLLIIGLGVFGSERLGDVNRASEVIRNHWLQDTRVLGDLSNYMSDYRTAETARLLSSTSAQIAANNREVAGLGDLIRRSERAYEAIAQEPEESRLYAQFAEQWDAYLAVAGRVLELARRGDTAGGVALYMTGSHQAFDLASDTLARLTDQTVAKARVASERAAEVYTHARTLIISAMLLAGSLLVAVVLYITRSILYPLLELAERMRTLAGHDTSVVIPSTHRDDEVGEMARAVAVFRDNAVALMNSERRSIAQAATLEEALENEQRLTAQQRNFVSMTSHEFRTPLTIIDGHAQRLIKMRGRLEPADIEERGARIRSAVKRMTNIMDSLLGASRLLDGQAVFQPDEIDPGALLREACQAHREATRSANVVEDFVDLPARIPGDPKLLFHVFSNLISNAVKFSAQGSPIEVEARGETSWLVVRVKDRGIGIPARDRRRLFERYFRGGNATGIAGTGVGLHLVAMVVALHRGEVFAESLEGVGSTFVVRLPVAATDTAGTTTRAEPDLVETV